jgi:hypothetical protein
MYRCPKCNGTDLWVEALVQAAVDAEGHVELVSFEGRFEPESDMLCTSCSFSGQARMFNDAPSAAVQPSNPLDVLLRASGRPRP